MSLLNVAGISFRYSSTIELLLDATFAIGEGDCLAIAGANGAGKSTLLRILAGDLEPGTGGIIRRKELRVAYADQQYMAVSGSLFEIVFGARPHLARLREWLLAAEVQSPSDYAELVNEYEAASSYAAEAHTERILSGLGFTPAEWALPLSSLSGGSGRGQFWRARCIPRRICCSWTNRPIIWTSRLASGSKARLPGVTERAPWFRMTGRCCGAWQPVCCKSSAGE
jgi:ATPase subunit of ABC transporter with duplicated ATPase domains